MEIEPDPTPAPTIVAAPVQPPILQRQIQSDPIAYETVGEIDLVDVEKEFFKQTQFLLTPYLAKNVGFLLRTYKLTLTFVENTNEGQSTEEGDSQFFLNIFEITVDFELQGSREDMASFTKETLQQVVANFFKGNNLAELIEWLNNKEIPIRMIREYDPDNASPLPPSSGQDGSDGDSGGISVLIVVVIIVCFVFVVMAVVVVFYLRKRSQKFKMFAPHVESPLNSVYSDGDEDGSSPGRLGARGKHDLEGAFSDEQFRTIDLTGDNLVSPVETTSEQDDIQRLNGAAISEDKERSIYFHDDAQFEFNPFNDDSNALFSDQDIPEFGKFVSTVQPNATGQRSNDVTESAVYYGKRRFQEDEGNDAAIAGLPDDTSEDSGENKIPPIS